MSEQRKEILAKAAEALRSTGETTVGDFADANDLSGDMTGYRMLEALVEAGLATKEGEDEFGRTIYRPVVQE